MVKLLSADFPHNFTKSCHHDLKMGYIDASRHRLQSALKSNLARHCSGGVVVVAAFPSSVFVATVTGRNPGLEKATTGTDRVTTVHARAGCRAAAAP
jgi:hypothetical protein